MTGGPRLCLLRRSSRFGCEGWISLVGALVLALAACSYPTRNQELASFDPRQGYRWGALAPTELESTLLVVTASGGGTRAAAFTLSALSGLADLELASGRSLADEIDVISSVSGGSVTAAYFALEGPGGFQDLEDNFIRQDGISAILWRGLKPVELAALATPSRERIDLLIDYLDESLFHGATFDSLRQGGERPLLILNAGDMVDGAPFAFTQNTFDLICSDLDRLALSVAVAASAAFPGALSPVTLTNYAPCQAQQAVSWPVTWVNQAAASRWYDNPSRVRRGRDAQNYALGAAAATPAPRKYIHLLDGGIADNLGIAEPFRLLSSNEVSPNFFNQISRGQIDKVVFVLVNARSDKPSRLSGEIATPGALDMVQATINAAIDNTTFGNFERLETLLRERLDAAAAEFPEPLASNFRKVETYFLPIDFDAIADDACRDAFQSIATSWTLAKREVDALMIAGKALLKSAPKLSRLAADLGLAGIDRLPELEEACAAIRASG